MTKFTVTITNLDHLPIKVSVQTGKYTAAWRDLSIDEAYDLSNQLTDIADQAARRQEPAGEQPS